MEKLEEVRKFDSHSAAGKLPVSVIIAARNEAKNLPRCLRALREFGEVYVIDSQSTDETFEIARSHGAEVVQFHYQGGWPKKRQWAMDTLSLGHDWILLLDADEVVTPELIEEIRSVIRNPAIDGYSILLRTWFLGRALRHGDVGLWKLALFRRGKGRYECRLKDQDASMADMEVHEHVVVEGATSKLRNPLMHHNVESLSRYIQKHDQYSNWESHVLLQLGDDKELPPSLFGTQAQRRRWLKRKLFAVPGSPVLLFLYRYVLRFGFLDGVPGLIYCGFQAVQMFHTKAKIYELKLKRTPETRG
ncbi:MAG TPA: glycosyltransferase family 2 protein [Candidatus Sulfotelmatobacter sp.]|jgi:glycosyltransferase involved in cell wall biosynthesis|nr:glycosyltransferase family 2 protein [Candidatus Sulfotelmatobacter sp.]